MKILLFDNAASKIRTITTTTKKKAQDFSSFLKKASKRIRIRIMAYNTQFVEEKLD